MATPLANTAGVDLGRTLDSGQAFRWRWDDGTRRIATGVVGRRIVRLAQDARGIRLLSPDTPDARDAMRRYLGVIPRRAHPRRVEATLAADPVLARLLPHTAGISLLSQDPWEVLISFIISQNNNIPKIMRSIDGLSRALGEPLAGGVAAFPAPERLAAASWRTLAACSLGYRARYVRSVARLVADGRLDLAALSRMDHAAAREALLDLPGVGEKVGDCVLLFGLGHRAAFPIDVWVRRAVERLYFRGRPRRLRDIQAFARERFGPLAGYAQQHLFAYARARLCA
ncbi:MAG: DNA-3-methyladenine glycosylase family protein [bacterium]